MSLTETGRYLILTESFPQGVIGAEEGDWNASGRSSTICQVAARRPTPTNKPTCRPSSTICPSVKYSPSSA